MKKILRAPDQAPKGKATPRPVPAEPGRED